VANVEIVPLTGKGNADSKNDGYNTCTDDGQLSPPQAEEPSFASVPEVVRAFPSCAHDRKMSPVA
jgi:hypothetical protein